MPLNTLFARFRTRSAEFGPVAPQEPVIAIGDIHGCKDLLANLLSRLPDVPVVCLGDYVDRGIDSAGVLKLLQDRADITCLRGNHEDLLLRFLRAPEENGARWLRYGGLQTLASYGISGVTETSRGPDLRTARDALQDAMGETTIAWLKALPLMHQTGNLVFVHAGTDPAKSIDQQPTHTLLWGHPDFDTKSREDGIWVVHGHTIVDQPTQADGRIAIDTGAYATGRLTAVGIEADSVDFLTT